MIIPSIITVAAFAAVGIIQSEARSRGGPFTAVEILITVLLYAAAGMFSLAAWLIWSLAR